MAFAYPVALELAGRRVLVIGEIAVREGKVAALLAGGADDVVVIAEEPAERLSVLERTGVVRVVRRRWRETDLDGAFLCVGSGADSLERDAIAAAARARRVLLNVVDDPSNCDWSAPAVIRRGDLVIAVSTGGASPALAKQLRARLSETFGEEWSEIVSVLRRVREATLPAIPSIAERSRRWSQALDLGEAAELATAGRLDELERRLRDRLLRRGPTEAAS
jgi:precorrin-2 dehydrogenase/sirohydrochlorin ferrochelatase